MAAILFLGGWTSPLPASWAFQATEVGPLQWYHLLINGLFFDGPILFLLKAMFMFYVQIWIRWTLPRVRIDQVLYGCVQVLLPLMMAVLLGNTLWILLVDHLQIGFVVWLDRVLHWALVAIGTAMAAGMVGIAIYGYRNRLRLPGPLVIRHLPGA